MKNVLVTGANGLVGTAMRSLAHNQKAPHTHYNFHFVSRDSADLTRQDDVDRIFDSVRPDYVLHAAGRVGGIKRNLEQPVDQFEQNILMNTIVVRACHNYNVEKLIAFSSICVLSADDLPLKEDSIHKSAPFHAHWFYAHAKRMLDVQIEAYRKQYGSNFCSVLPGSLFGENDNYSLSSGHVVPSLIHKCFWAKKNNIPFEVWGSGTPEREFLYSKDMARICLKLFELPDRLPQNLLVSNSSEHSIKHMVEKICNIFDYHNVAWDTTKPDGQLRRTSDLSKFESTIPNFEFTNLDKALKNSIKWFLEKYPNCRI